MRARLNQILLDSMPCIAMLVRPQTWEIVVSNEMAAKAGAVPGKTCYETWAQRETPCPWCRAPTLWAKGEAQHLEIENAGIVWDVHWRPVSEDLYLHFALDITERKQAEQERREYQRQLQDLAMELSSAEERERRRVAEDLHDGVAQQIAGLRLILQALRTANISGTHRAALNESLAVLKQMAQDVRTLTFELCPPILYEMGLAPAVAGLVEQYDRAHEATFRFVDDGQAKPLGEEVRGLVFRSVQELLTNVAKHAQARNVAVSTAREGDWLTVRIVDDGIGFDVSRVGAPGREGGGFGLFGIRERLRHLGGRLEARSQPGHGSRITLMVPLAAQDA